jgi:hypothetical protein
VLVAQAARTADTVRQLTSGAPVIVTNSASVNAARQAYYDALAEAAVSLHNVATVSVDMYARRIACAHADEYRGDRIDVLARAFGKRGGDYYAPEYTRQLHVYTASMLTRSASVQWYAPYVHYAIGDYAKAIGALTAEARRVAARITTPDALAPLLTEYIHVSARTIAHRSEYVARVYNDIGAIVDVLTPADASDAEEYRQALRTADASIFSTHTAHAAYTDAVILAEAVHADTVAAERIA